MISLPKPPDHFDLNQVNRIHIWVADVDRAPQDGIALEEMLMGGDFQERSHGARQPSAELLSQRLQRRRHELAVVLGGDARVGFGQHHLEQIEGRTEVRPLPIHRLQSIELAPIDRALQRFFQPKP